jgi:hypothetical protein
MALVTLARLRSACLATSTLESNIPHDRYNHLICFVPRQVQPLLIRVANELLAVQSIPQDLAQSTMAVLMGHTLIDHIEMVDEICGLCHPDQEDQRTRSLVEAQDAGGEYSFRMHRLIRHLQHTHSQVLSAAENDLIDSEIARLSKLLAQIVAHVVALFRRYGLDEEAEFAQAVGILHDGSAGYYLFVKGKRLEDCLMRTTLHQWLDNIPEKNMVGSIPGAPCSGELEVLRDNAHLYDLEHRDILGRTALYIAITRGWRSVVNILLEAGADLTIVTTSGRFTARRKEAGSSNATRAHKWELVKY